MVKDTNDCKKRLIRSTRDESWTWCHLASFFWTFYQEKLYRLATILKWLNYIYFIPFCSSTTLPVYAYVCVCARVCASTHTCTHTLSRSVLSDFATPWTIACQAPLSLEFPRQEYWSGLHLLFQGTFLTQGSNPHLQCLLYWQEDSLPLSYLGSCAIQ